MSKKHTTKLIKWLLTLEDETFVHAGSIAMYLQGGFGMDKPEDEIVTCHSTEQEKLNKSQAKMAKEYLRRSYATKV